MKFNENKTLADKSLLGLFTLYLALVLVTLILKVGPLVPLLETLQSNQQQWGQAFTSNKVTIALFAFLGLAVFAPTKFFFRMLSRERT